MIAERGNEVSPMTVQLTALTEFSSPQQRVGGYQGEPSDPMD